MIWAAMLSIYTEGQPIDSSTLSDKLENVGTLQAVGGRAFLLELMTAVASSSSVKSYAQTVRKYGTARRMFTLLTKASESIMENRDGDISAAIDIASQVTGKALDLGMPSRPKEVSKLILEHEDSILLPRERGMATGFKGIDKFYQGFGRTDFVILAARPAAGKSTFSLNLAMNMCRAGKRVVYFSLEMEKGQLMDKMVTAMSWVPSSMFGGKIDPGSPEHKRVASAINDISGFKLMIDDSPRLSSADVLNRSKYASTRLGGLDLIIIDHIQLMGSKDKDLRKGMVETTGSLKEYAKVLNCPILALSQLSREVERDKPAIPKMHHLKESGCLSGDTEVSLADGSSVNIRELAEAKNTIGIKTIAVNGKLKMVEEEVVRAFYSGNKMTYKVSLASGLEIRATMNHKFLTCNGWKALEDLKVGDRVAVPRELPSSEVGSSNSFISSDEAEFIGHMIGDGCVLKTHVVQYTSDEEAGIDRVSELAKNLFGITARRKKYRKATELYLASPYGVSRKRSNPVIELYHRLGMKLVKGPEKRLPKAIFSCSKEIKASMLRGLWATDGSLTQPKNVKNLACYYSTTSFGLAKDVKDLLWGLGIWSSSRKSSKRGYKDCYQVCVEGAGEQLKFVEAVRPFGKQGRVAEDSYRNLKAVKSNPNLDTIPKEMNQPILDLIREKRIKDGEVSSLTSRSFFKKNWLRKHSLSRENYGAVSTAVGYAENLSSSDVRWCEITGIIPYGYEEVFDLTTPINHNFVANGIVVHNSLEADTDAIFFIYRKARDPNYSPDEITPMEANSAQVILAKNRHGQTGSAYMKFNGEKSIFYE